MTRVPAAAFALALSIVTFAACASGPSAPPPEDVVDLSRRALREVDSVIVQTRARSVFNSATQEVYNEFGFEEDEIMFNRDVIEESSLPEEFTEFLFIPDDYYLRAGDGDWYVVSPWDQGQRFADLPDISVHDITGYYREITGDLTDLVRKDDAELADESFFYYEGVYQLDAPGFVLRQAGLWLHKDSLLPRQVHLEASDQGNEFELTVEFVDYNLPVLLPEIPDARPFRDYELASATQCVGEAVLHCLEAQDELDEDASCLHDGPVVCLVPLGQVEPELMHHLVEYYRDRYDLPIAINRPFDIPLDMLDRERGQLRAGELLEYAGWRAGVVDPERIVIAVTPIDIYMEDRHYAWVFSVRAAPPPDGRGGVVSTFRMQPQTYGGAPDEELFRSRVRKMVSKYIGIFYFELAEDADPRSPMYGGITSVPALDYVSEDPLVP